jgi:large subunit ribosomal protein L3
MRRLGVSSAGRSMTPALLGKKLGMTRIYNEKGAVVPVTVVQAGPCHITQIKTVESDGYNAVQLGFEDVPPRHSTMPLMGHTARSGVGPKRHFAEVRLKEPTGLAAGAEVDVSIFDGVQFVDVVGTSKGKGFAGVMKRYNFGGQPASHGTERKHRSRGSITSRATARGSSGRPKKGLKMAGHMGDARVTTRNHPLVRIDAENNLLLIKGPLPGANGSLVYVRKSITARIPRAAESK